MAETFDAIIIGGGIMGCSTALQLARHGFKLGPAVGVMMADLVTGERQAEFDPHLFRFSRFAESDHVRGQYEYSIVG